MPRPNHLVDHFLQTAEFLADAAPNTNLGKAYRRRAISTAYYAVFQALCYVVTNHIVSWSGGGDLIDAVFRSLDHKVAVRALQTADDPDLKAIGAIVGRLQNKRNDADYMPPGYNPGPEEVRDVIDQARDAERRVHSLTRVQRRRLIAAIVSKSR